MISVKIIYRTDKVNKNNEHGLYLRIIKNRKPKYISLGIYLKPEHWDDENKRVRKSNPNSQRWNNLIAKKVHEAQGVAIKMETSDKYALLGTIKDEIMGKSSMSFFQYSEKYLNDLNHKQKIGTYRKAKAIVAKMKEFTKGSDLLFDELTVTWLKSFEHHLRTKYSNKTNTINSNFRTIRAIFNLAINEEIINYDKNPFRRFKLYLEKVNRDYLTDEELKQFELAPLQKDSMKDHHRNMYVFSAYAGGLRISDILLLRWKNFDGERIVMQTRKTSSMVSIMLPEKALEILEIYYSADVKPEQFIFPILDNDEDYSDKLILFKAISSATSYTNGDLKEIAEEVGLEKKVSFHTARHSFATRALKKGIRLEYVSKLMGHSNIQTTQVYAKIVNEELDKAMAVFN